MAEACGAWGDTGACGRPAVERLHFLHTWLDHPAPAGLALCVEHLRAYAADQLL